MGKLALQPRADRARSMLPQNTLTQLRAKFSNALFDFSRGAVPSATWLAPAASSSNACLPLSTPPMPTMGI